MGKYTAIESEFIRERIKETRWENREYIDMLCLIAALMAKSGPGSFAEGMRYHMYQKDWPVECECIRLELEEGRTVSADEFRATKEPRQEEYRRREEKERRHRDKEEKEARRVEERERLDWGGDRGKDREV
ncbi:MAG: hypothetical protein ACOC6F_03490 [bacterium]